MYYIRFTSDIYADIERGHSFDFRDNSRLDGLCAWSVPCNLGPYASDQEIIEEARKSANNIAKNSYCGYSSESQYAVLKGNYVGSSNDGVLIKVEKLISVETI